MEPPVVRDQHRDQLGVGGVCGDPGVQARQERGVEPGGEYALVASMGGAPTNPVWYHNLVADPHNVMVQDGPAPFEVDVREVTGDERAAWWERSVAVFPNYADYQAKTARTIPVLVASPR